MKHAFVTGGSGFVGRPLIERLVAQGVSVTALARSESSARSVAKLGAEPCRAGLGDITTMTAGMQGCDTVFHIAGHLTEWDSFKVFHDANVDGTRNVLQAAREAGAEAFIAAGASAVVMGQPKSMVDIPESLPLQYPSWGPYIATKAAAERMVREANHDRFRTVVVRPPLIWGRGMPMLDEMVAAVEAGQFALPDGGRQKMSTSHVDNVVECLILAAERGHGGEAYFVTDGDSTTLRQVVTDLLATRGMPPVERTAPFGFAWRMAALMEGAWRLFGIKSKPPVTRQTLRMIGQDFTLDITKARRELGYVPVITRAEGLASMRSGGTSSQASQAVDVAQTGALHGSITG